MKPSEILSKAAELIEPEGKWTQGESARNEAGHPVSVQDSGATCFCAYGALMRITGKHAVDSAAARFLGEAIGTSMIAQWNDKRSRRQAYVVRKFRKAAELAKSEGQ